MSGIKRLRIAIVLVLIGVITELVAFVDLLPGTFMVFLLIGLPCMALGMLIYIVHVWRQLRKKDAL